ncbi:T9SS type A sorting domain-containing protein, partial [candidate division WOR-3 bacterium]|nr:T9SS type A sorting domain-containing protein [candidate division WOR-3 bacterium]
VYPSLAKAVNDTLHIIYMHDLGLGSYVQDEGPRTDNPYIYHKVPIVPGDIEVVSIDDPPHYPDTTSYSGETYSPKVTYHNKGAETTTFQARFEIESPSYYSALNEDQDTVMLRNGFYYDIVELTLGPGATEQVVFDPFYLDPDVLTDPVSGFKAILYYYGMSCLLGDTDPLDNKIVDSCKVDTIWIEGVEEPENGLAFAVDISPNPSMGRTRISYTLPKDGAVNIKVFDGAGRLIRHFDDNTKAGTHTFEWNGRNIDGRAVPSGVYFVKVTSDDREIGRRLILIR